MQTVAERFPSIGGRMVNVASNLCYGPTAASQSVWNAPSETSFGPLAVAEIMDSDSCPACCQRSRDRAIGPPMKHQ